MRWIGPSTALSTRREHGRKWQRLQRRVVIEHMPGSRAGYGKDGHRLQL